MLAVVLAVAVQLTALPALATAAVDSVEIVKKPIPASTETIEVISSKQALEIFCSAFPEITEGRNLVAEFEDYAGNSVWRIHEAEQGGLRPSQGQRVSGQIDAASGEVQSMYYNPGDDYYQGKTVTFTREQAQVVARQFLQEKQPQKYAQIQLRDDMVAPFPSRNLNLCYIFNWQRLVNGAAIDFDSISVGVNAYTGAVTQYACSWHELELPAGNDLIPAADMANKLQEQIELIPCYIDEQDSMGQRTGRVVPAYRLNINAPLVDARTGHFLDYRGRRQGDAIPRLYEQAFVPVINAPALNEPLEPEAYVNPEVAMQAARDFFSLMGYTDQIRKSGSGGSSGGGIREEHWSYSLQDPEKHHSHLRVEVNAFTGKVIGFSDEDYDGISSEPVMTYAKGKDLAQAAIRKFDPDKVEQVAFCQTNWEDDRGYYHYQFVRLVNGIPFNRDGINITLDGSNGKIRAYLKQWRPVQCEVLPHLQDPQMIKDKLWSAESLKFSYILARDEQYMTLGESIPAYLIPYTVFNAVTGEVLNNSQLSQLSKDKSEPWSAHWAAPALSLLNNNGLLSDTVQPDKAMTRREILKVLVVATNPRDYREDEQQIEVSLADIPQDDPDLSVFKLAIQRGIIPSAGAFLPDQPLSREDLAIWLVNSLGFQEIAEMPNRIDTPFRDVGQISANKPNYVGLVSGLGLLTPDSAGNFRPQEEVSWAQMALVAGRLAPRALRQPGSSIWYR